jgi:spermidine synthase
VFTGFSGLAYEIAWEKYLATMLGAHSEATAAVLAIFLGGLSVGYWLFGIVTRRLVERGVRDGRPAPLLRVYGMVEAGIGAYCLIFPTIFPIARMISVHLPGELGVATFLADVALATLLIGPASVLMGATIPILTQALSRSLADATRFHAFVYAFNTAGAFVGALAAGFFLIPHLGLDGLMYAMGVINLVVGAIFFILGARPPEIVSLEPESQGSPRSEISQVYTITALLLGFAMMALQTILIRVGGLALGSSQYTFSMVVAAFVLCIAIGSLLVSILPTIARWVLPASLWGLAAGFTLLYTQLDDAPYWAHVLRSFFRDHGEAFYPFHTAAFLALLVGLGPAIVISGAALPLLFHAVRREVGGLGATAGRLYSLNTLGSLFGALLGGYVLLFWLDLHQVYRIALAALVIGAVLVTGRVLPRVPRYALVVGLLVAFTGLGFLDAWRPEAIASGLFRTRDPQPWSYLGPEKARSEGRLVFYDDDPTSTISVLEYPRPDGKFERSIRVNGKPDAHTSGDLNTMLLAALVPALFAQNAENSFLVGLGTGITAGGLAALDEMQSVTVAEISEGVLKAAPLFDFANGQVSNHPKMHLVRSDAYRALVRSGKHYDVIASVPSNPWVNGVEMLFSREFLEAARDRLTPGGVYAQWYHRYESDTATVSLVLRTYASVFDRVAVWYLQRGDMLLLGFQDDTPIFDVERLERRMQLKGFRSGFERLGIRTLSELLVHEVLPVGALHAARFQGPLHTLHHPILSFQAGRAFFSGQSATLPFTGYGAAARIGTRNSLLRRHLQQFNGEIPESIRQQMVDRACALMLPQCAILLADWSIAMPESGLWKRKLSAVRRSSKLERIVSAMAFHYLQLFLGGEVGGVGARQIPPGAAIVASQLYSELYLHGIPFRPSALVEIWKQCPQGGQMGPACKMGMRETEVMLFPARAQQHSLRSAAGE